MCCGIEQFFETVCRNEKGKQHQSDSDDELQSVCEEDESANDEQFFEDGDDCHDQGCERNDEHHAHRNVEHPAFFACRFEKYRKRDQYECCQELVGCAEQRPYIHITAETEEVSEEQRDNSCKIFVRQYSLDRCHRSRICAVAHEELLEGHTTDTCNRVKRGQGECRHAHRHDADSNVFRHTEHTEEACD